MENLTASLNQAQRTACETLEGPLLILAGAGSGKTRTLTHRIACLIKQELAAPYEVLAVTFTNKAAGELKERLAALLGEETSEKIWAMTFHSLCVRILRISGPSIRLKKSFSIADTDDSKRVIRDILKAKGLEKVEAGEVNKIQKQISYRKNHLQSPEDLKNSRHGQERELGRIWESYQAELTKLSAVDFDDLLLLTIKVLKTAEGQEKWGKRFQYLLVDEYQDTNQAQYQILKLLCKSHRNLCVVGDDDQSIYAFRGAQVEHILRFKEDWPDAAVVKLEDNYRSSGSIIRAANQIISQNQKRSPKALQATRDLGEAVSLLEAPEPWSEAQNIANIINTLTRQGVEAKEIAIAYRTNSQSRVLEEKLRETGLPYHIVGGLEFYKRAEIKTARAYLQLLANPGDYIAFERAIANPRRGIGDTSLRALIELADNKGISLLQVASSADKIKGLNKKAKEGLASFYRVYEEILKIPADRPFSEVLNYVLEKSGFLPSLREAKKSQEDQIQNLEELLTTAERYDHLPWPDALLSFLEHSALSEAHESGSAESITLMTLHATKGLEYDYVFLCGLEDDLFLREESTQADIEESRRLFYVGITRAREKLWLSYPKARKRWGMEGLTPSQPLRFLEDLPGEVERESLEPENYYQSYQKPQRGYRGAKTPAANPRQSPAYAQAEAWLKKIPKTSPPENATNFTPGQLVKHQSFGVGVVLKQHGDKVTVRFKNQDTKTLMPGYLKPINL